jgi:periplasmic protein TonB
MTGNADSKGDKALPQRLIWCVAMMIAIGLHAGAAVAFLQEHPPVLDAAEDTGVMMMVELAALPVASAADDPGDATPPAPDSAPSEATPPAPEVEEKLAAPSSNTQPQVDSTPYETPPDDLSRKATEKKDEQKPDETEATDAAQAQPPAPAAAASSATDGGAPGVIQDDQNAAKQQGTILEAREIPPSWQKSLMAHLGRHKRYPQEARQRRIQGETTIEFTVDRSGKVTASRIAHSSGSPILDQEVLAMLARAQPLPVLPAQNKAAAVQVVLPIKYKLH